MPYTPHTPGPWQINGLDRGTRHDGKRVLAITAPHPEGGGQDIAECLEDNARLIAAAPDMLEALQEALDALINLYERVYPNDESENGTTEIIDYVIATIEQARGN